MGVLHEQFVSGAMFTAGPSGANIGVSGINEITNRINVESGLLGTDIANLTIVSGAYVASSGAGVTDVSNLTAVSGAYVATKTLVDSVIPSAQIISGTNTVIYASGISTPLTVTSEYPTVKPGVACFNVHEFTVYSGMVFLSGTLPY